MAAETAAERFAREISSQSAERKARNWDAQPTERRHRRFVNADGSFQD